MVERTILLICRRYYILCTVRRVGYPDFVTIAISNVTLEHELVRAGMNFLVLCYFYTVLSFES